MSLKILLSAESRTKILYGFFLDFGPIIIFLATVRHFGFYTATFALMITTIISTIITFIKEKRIPYFALYVAALTLSFGWITISHHNPKFIQIRDTVYDLSFALTLIIGLVFRINLLKISFGHCVKLHLQSWNKLTYSWIVFFLINSMANEYVRRYFDRNVWVHFKTNMLFVTILFGVITLLFFYKHDDDKK